MPAAGYPLPPRCACAGSTAATRCARRWRCCWRRAPRCGRGGCCAACGADAVLGGGGYVAGPVGLAARPLRLPLVLTEADSHLGVTNRLLAPLAKRVFLAFPIEGRDGAAKWVVSGRPVPAGTGRRRPRARRAARFGIGAGRAVPAGVRRLARRAPAQRGGARGVRRRPRRARSCTPAGGATTTSCAARLDELGLAAALPPARLHRAVRRRARGRRPGRRARRRLGVGGGRGGAARRSSCPTRTRPPTTRPSNAPLHRARGRGRRGARRRARRAAAGARGRGAARRRPQRLGAMANAARAVARPDAAERIADELLALAR